MDYSSVDSFLVEEKTQPVKNVKDVKDDLEKYEELGCLHDMFERQARLTPNKLAIVDNITKMTFQELNEATDVLADHLVSLGVGPDRPVGIYMERCLEYAIAYIAILKAGGAYMPLDVSYPRSLLADIFTDAEPPCIIVNQTTAKKLSGQTTVVLHGDWVKRLKAENKKVGEIKRQQTNLENLACIVYSSGTTGKPKGIMNPHRSPVFSYTWRHLSHPFDPDDRVACNVFFVWEMLRPLLKGIPMYIIPDSVIYDPFLLAKFIKRHRITRILFTPSLLETVLDASNIHMKDFSSLRLIWFCGEVVTTSLLERCLTSLPWVKFFNLYSISESHDVAVADLNKFWGSVKDDQKRPKFAPVGKLCPGVHITILDDDKNVQPVGMPGEIYVGGPTLSRGYLNRPEINEKRFVPRPESVSTEVGERLYRTGDWGLLKSDRNLEICGRCDSMVKIRGYSIEVQAVEVALMSLEFVNACVVMAVGEEGEDKQLVAYVVAEEGTTKKLIKGQLKLKLPFYMIPSRFMFLESLPVLPSSGKLDKKALPPVQLKKSFNNAAAALGGDDDPSKPSTETERFLEDTWCEVLNMDTIDVQESFFELGGHSLLAARLLGKIREKFSNKITMQTLFTYPTISTLAGFLDADSTTASQTKISPLPKLNLQEEVKLHGSNKVNLDIQLRAFWRSQGSWYKSHRARILLTGATGFLGAFLLKDLLLQTKAQIYCLVRKSPDKTADQRLIENLEFYNAFQENQKKDLTKAYRKQVEAIDGDVALYELGLSEEDYTYLSYEIDYIIHAAAYVNLLYPYEALKGANVSGARNVLLFARAGKIKPLHYISTNAVFPNNLTLCKEASSSAVDVALLGNGYSQSKWVAEQLVMKAVSQGLPATIYRIGNISGDTINAGWNPADFILLILRASIMTLSWPKLDWHVEMTPVDFVSNCIVKLTQDLQLSIHKTFHIVQPNGVSGKWIYEWLKHEFNYNLELVPFDEWCKRVENLDNENIGSTPGHPDVKKMLESVTSSQDASFFSYCTTFDQTNFLSAVSSFELSYPEVNGALLRTYINELIKRNVIPPFPPKRESTLSERVAIVTGASSGIGRAIALRLANAGAKVCIAARSTDKLELLQKEIEISGGISTFFKCDITKRNEIQSLVNEVENLWGSIDILVNNAGVMLYTSMSSLKMDAWEQMIDVNCKGVLNGIGAVLPVMIKSGRGHIINISSDAGVRGFPGLAVYSGTKFFVEGVSQALRHEVAENGIKVTCIQPGDVKTNINTTVVDREAFEKYDGSRKVKILEPEDIAKAVLFAATQPEYSAVNNILIEPRLAPV